MACYEVPTSKKGCKWRFEGFTKNSNFISILANIISIVVKLPTGKNGHPEIWKYSKHFTNPTSWDVSGNDGTRIQPLADKVELYNITRDPKESKNFLHEKFSTPESVMIETILENLLAEQSRSESR